MTVTAQPRPVAIVRVQDLRVDVYAPDETPARPLCWVGAVMPYPAGPWSGKRRDQPNVRVPLVDPLMAFGWLIATTAELGYSWPEPEEAPNV